MTIPKVFITGATGYIGGDALFAFHRAHPEWHYSCLVRDSDRAAVVATEYPAIRMVYGSLDDHDLIKEEAIRADIVLDCAHTDHAISSKAILAGLATHPKSSPGFFLHMCGSGVLLYSDLERGSFGEASSKVWDDVKDRDAIDAIPDHAMHRLLDAEILSSGLNTALVSPPCIYGAGRGPDNRRSVQLPSLARRFLQRGRGFHVGDGLSEFSEVHVHDLSDAFLLLAEKAASGGADADWGTSGYYFIESGAQVWGETSRGLARTAKNLGLITTDDVDSLEIDEIEQLQEYGCVYWGTNCKTRGTRVRQLGWTPKRVGMNQVFEEILKSEKYMLDNDIIP